MGSVSRNTGVQTPGILIPIPHLLLHRHHLPAILGWAAAAGELYGAGAAGTPVPPSGWQKQASKRSGVLLFFKMRRLCLCLYAQKPVGRN